MQKSNQVKKSVTGHEGVLTVSRTVFNQIDEEKKYIEIRPFGTSTARVGVKLGRTVNLGNYESARIDVMFEMPCYAEEAKAMYEEIMEHAATILSQEVNKIASRVHVVQSEEMSVEELL